MAKKTQVIEKGDPAYRAQQEYGPAFLRIYDALILGVFCRVLWHSPAREIVADYERLVSRRHLEIGPGTGYLLDKARLPDDLELTLADPNPVVLDYAARRLARYTPTTVELDVRKPLPLTGPYDSVGMNGVLHCLPGPIERKASAVQSVAAVLADDGVLFGGTIVVDSPAHTRWSRALIRSNNRRGIFGNDKDTLPGVRSLFEAEFTDVDVRLRGTMAVFTARAPRGRDVQAETAAPRQS